MDPGRFSIRIDIQLKRNQTLPFVGHISPLQNKLEKITPGKCYVTDKKGRRQALEVRVYPIYGTNYNGFNIRAYIPDGVEFETDKDTMSSLRLCFLKGISLIEKNKKIQFTFQYLRVPQLDKKEGEGESNN